MDTDRANLYRPFFLSAGILIVDQISKALIVGLIPQNRIGFRTHGDFLWIVHARNTGVAFSMGDSLPPWLRALLFSLLPLVLIGGILIYYFREEDATPLQRWALCAIIGGGLGNIVDRLARPNGVVDFVSVRFYGLFGLDRWPTFNVADSTVVLGALAIAATSLLAARKRPG